MSQLRAIPQSWGTQMFSIQGFLNSKSNDYSIQRLKLGLLAVLIGVFCLCGPDLFAQEPKAATPATPTPKAAPPAPDKPAADKAAAAPPAVVVAVQPARLAHPFSRRQRAPALEGGVGWLNTATPIDLKELKGKFVLLDFWTYCCINCMHVLPELKKLERAYPNSVVVIGVHSAKFDTEEETKNIREAVLRYEIEHPVVNDAKHEIWDKYLVNSWPSIRIIDPEGNLVAIHSGEIEFESLDQFFKSALPYYEQNNLLNDKPIKFDLEAGKAARTPLRFPGKVLSDPVGKRLFITDSNHNRIVVCDWQGKLQMTIGSGTAGARDGNLSTAQFDHPQGLALSGQTLYVADTENHLLRKVDLAKKTVSTIAGIGQQSRNPWPGLPDEDSAFNPFTEIPTRFVGVPKKTAMNSPWDLWLQGDALYIAMAGPHQIWKMTLDEREIGPFAGNGRENITDGRLLPFRPFQTGNFSSFAQPSGLAGDGKQLFVADSEGSAIRAVPLDNKPASEVSTLVGTPGVPGALFNFGDINGPLPKARLQHCLAVAYDSGKLYVADTYNNKIKELDLAKKEIRTFAGTGKAGLTDGVAAEFDEPAGLAIGEGTLFVADTNNHAIRTIELSTGKVRTLAIEGLQAPAPVVEVAAEPQKKPSFRNAKQVKLEAVKVKPKEGQLELQVKLTLPDEWHMNPQAPTVYLVEVEGDAGPVDRQMVGTAAKNTEAKETFSIPLKLSKESGQDVVKISLNYYICKGGPEGICTFGSVVWTAPIEVTDAGKDAVVPLPLTVTAEP